MVRWSHPLRRSIWLRRAELKCGRIALRSQEKPIRSRSRFSEISANSSEFYRRPGRFDGRLAPAVHRDIHRAPCDRCKLHFGFPEASGQTGGSRTRPTHRKHQSRLVSARPCLAAFATPLVAAFSLSASFAFTPRLSAYSLPSIGAMCGGSLSRLGVPSPIPFPCAAIHFRNTFGG